MCHVREVHVTHELMMKSVSAIAGGGTRLAVHSIMYKYIYYILYIIIV
eukprot:COSAG05_NODE_16027_length_355_cov_0.980469_2_plen_47_part_01